MIVLNNHIYKFSWLWLYYHGYIISCSYVAYYHVYVTYNLYKKLISKCGIKLC